jgi:hypothetical protein
MNESSFNVYVDQYKRGQKTLKQIVASIIVKMGYEPRCWAETLEIAMDVVAGERGRKDESD